MPHSLNNKVVWITGASSGIGEALAYELARKGAKLILSSRRKEELDRVRGNCVAKAHPNIRVLPIDLSEGSTLKLSVEAAIQLFGSVDMLINNGGINHWSLAKDTAIKVDRRIMEVDYFGQISLTKFLLPHLIKRKTGHIVVVSSVMGKIGTPNRSSYAAAKHALHGFFDSLRAELWKDSKNLFVTIVCPGWIRTNITLHTLTGTGDQLSEVDPNTTKGLRPEDFARKMIRAIVGKKEEVYIGGSRELSALRLKRFFPRLFSRIIRKANVSRSKAH